MLASHCTISINGPRETIFALIADLAHYNRWLPRSRAFRGVTEVSPPPTGVGTTYADGPMRGSITDYDPPERITFQQSLSVRVLLLTGRLDVYGRYTLEAVGPGGQMTQVQRDVTFNLHGILRILQVAQPIVARTMRRECRRVLQMMKRYIEDGPVT